MNKQPIIAIAMTEPHASVETGLPALTRLELELARGSEPISGYIHDGAARRPFSGWVELTRFIAAAHEPTQRHRPATSGQDAAGNR